MTPHLQLETLFVFDKRGRIISTNEPTPTGGPRFILIRGSSSCSWALREDVPSQVADQVGPLARSEPPTDDNSRTPVHASEYLSLLGGTIESGPAFFFPHELAAPGDITTLQTAEPLQRNFRGWIASEIPGRWPIVAKMVDQSPISICFSARFSERAAEAGVETAAEFRGHGFAGQVVSAWANAIRSTGRTPLYSISWNNTSSLSVARKLSLIPYALDWSVLDPQPS